MERSVLVEKQNHALGIFMAFIFFLNGTLHLLDDRISPFRTILGIVMIILGTYYSIHSILGFSANSKYSAKIKVTDKLIELRAKFWGSVITLNWQEVKNIRFSNYRVDFELHDESKSIHYSTTAKRSIQLKQLLRETAKQHSIEVSGG